MKQSARKAILSVKPYIPGKPIEEVKRELGIRNVIKMASNENPYSPSPRVLKAIATAAAHVNRYPDSGCFYLREELAKLLNVKKDFLVFGNGSDEIIALATKVFVGEKEEVIMAKPSFLMYDIFSNISGANIKAIPLTEDRHYDLLRMKKAVTSKTRIIFLGNPDNPSGKFFTQKEMEGFLKEIPKRILVFIDEAYYEFVKDPNYVNSIGLLKKYKNVIVARTFSKMYGLAGLRIGYGIANKDIIDLMNRARDPFNVNSLAQVAAVACLKDRAYYVKIAKEISLQRTIISEGLEKLGVDYEESFTNFILIDVKDDATIITKKLMKQGVIVRNMNFCGWNNFIRISVGTHKENQKLLKALEKSL